MPPRDFTPDSAIMRTKVDDASHLNAKVVLHLGEETGKYITTQVRSFAFERMTNGVGNFTMSLVDSNWVEIERHILNAKGKGFIEYGYENALSKPYKIQIMGLDLEPYLNYVVLNISGLCLGTKFLENSTFLSSVRQKPSTGTELTATGIQQAENRALHDFIIDLAKSAGFEEANIDVDRTTIPVAKDGIFGTEDVAKVFNSKGMNLFTFIVKQLLPYAITPEDSKALESQKENNSAYDREPLEITPFIFYVSLDDNGKETFHFHKQDKYKDDAKRLKRVFNLYSDPETRVISYKPSFEHMIANITRGTSVFAWTYSPLSGTEYEESNRVEQSPSAIQPFLDYSTTAVASENNILTNPTEASKILLYCPDAMLNKLKGARALQMSTNAPLTAELLITGDPGYNICDVIDINVNIPFGDSRGYPHNTSNRYMVLGIMDNIDMGVFTTNLQLATAHGSTDRAKEVKKKQDDEKAASDKSKIEEQKKKLVEEVKKETTPLMGRNPRR